MQKFIYDVTTTETYKARIEVEAESQEQAKEILDAQLEEHPLSERRNTFDGSETETSPVKQ